MCTAPNDRLVRLIEVVSCTGISRSNIYVKMAAGDFPKPVRVGARAVRWRESEINAWVAARPRATGDNPP